MANDLSETVRNALGHAARDALKSVSSAAPTGKNGRAAAGCRAPRAWPQELDSQRRCRSPRRASTPCAAAAACRSRARHAPPRRWRQKQVTRSATNLKDTVSEQGRRGRRRRRLGQGGRQRPASQAAAATAAAAERAACQESERAGGCRCSSRWTWPCRSRRPTTSGPSSRTGPSSCIASPASRRTTTARSSFATKIWGKTKEFEAKIETQRPDERIKWRVSQGITHTGVVTFHELAPRADAHRGQPRRRPRLADREGRARHAPHQARRARRPAPLQGVHRDAGARDGRLARRDRGRRARRGARRLLRRGARLLRHRGAPGRGRVRVGRGQRRGRAARTSRRTRIAPRSASPPGRAAAPRRRRVWTPRGRARVGSSAAPRGSDDSSSRSRGRARGTSNGSARGASSGASSRSAEGEVELVQVARSGRLGQRQVLGAVEQELVGRPQGFQPELVSVRRAEVGDREACRGRQALGASGCRRGARRGGSRRSDHLPLDEELAHVGLVQSTTAQRR